MTELCRYEYDRDELTDLGAELAQETQRGLTLRNDRALAMADFAAILKKNDALVADLAKRLIQGYEMREIECKVRLNEPIPGKAQIVRMDTGEIVRERAMTPEEMQRGLFEQVTGES